MPGTSPGSAGGFGDDGPRRQPSAIAITEPVDSITRPVTPFDSVDASHVTTGAIQRGSIIFWTSSGIPRSSVIRVSAPGARLEGVVQRLALADVQQVEGGDLVLVITPT